MAASRDPMQPRPTTYGRRLDLLPNGPGHVVPRHILPKPDRMQPRSRRADRRRAASVSTLH